MKNWLLVVPYEENQSSDFVGLNEILDRELRAFAWYKPGKVGKNCLMLDTSDVGDNWQVLINKYLVILKELNGGSPQYALFDYTVGYVIDPQVHEDISVEDYQAIVLEEKNMRNISVPESVLFAEKEKKPWWQVW